MSAILPPKRSGNSKPIKLTLGGAAAEPSSSQAQSSSDAELGHGRAAPARPDRLDVPGRAEQDALTGEIMATIRGDGEQDSMRPRSQSRESRLRGPRRPSFETRRSNLEPPPATPASTSAIDDDDDIEVNAEDLEDLGRLGEGASGEVRRMRHRPTGLLIAKKTIATSPNPEMHRQHLRELAFNRDCFHPHIVRYYGAFLEERDTQIGICMEYCEAGSLEAIYKRIKGREGRTGEKVLAKIAESVLQGLVYLHDQKIIHRDIKPSNVLVTRNGQVKLCDFGVSGELVNSLAGTFVGTSFYMSPERIRGAQYSITSDVWSLALTVLEVALNRFPFPGEGEPPLNGPIELFTYVMSMPPPALKDEPGIKWSNAFRDYLRESLDKEPKSRPSPQKLLSHPWIRRSIERNPQPDLGRWVKEIWEWQS